MVFNTVYAASQAACVAQDFLDKINQHILYPLIIFLVALALLMFLYGAFRYVWGGADSSARSDGRKHMIYGVIGLLVMTSAGAILAIAANTFDLSSDAPNCDTDARGGSGNYLRDFGV